MQFAKNTMLSIIGVAMSVAAFTASADDDKWRAIQGLKISASEAVSLAIAESKGEAIELDLDFDDGRAYYDIEVQGRSTRHDIKIDANSGKVLSNRSDDDDDDKNKRKANVSMQEAIKIAENQTKARVKEVDLKDRGDRNSYYEIKAVSADREYELDIDANSGKVLKQEIDD